MKVYFYYDSEGVGGAQLLLARVSAFFIQSNLSVGLITRNNSIEDVFIYKYLVNLGFNNFDVLRLNSDFYHSAIKDSDVIVTPLSNLILLANLNFLNNPKVFLWDMHPYNLVELHSFSFFYKNSIFTNVFKRLEFKSVEIIKEISVDLCLKDSIYFMCMVNYKFNSEFYGVNFKKNYLPIFSGTENISQSNLERSITSMRESGKLSFLWVSRLDDDKVKILNLLISDIEKFCFKSSVKITLHVVGSGNAELSIIEPENFKLIRTGVLIGSQLKNYVHNKIDIGIAVGTAALDLALMKIPVVLAPGADAFKFYKSIEMKYKFLYEINGFDVAVERYHSNSALSFTDVVNSAMCNYNEISRKTFSYVILNHTLDANSHKVLYAISNSKGRYSDLLNLRDVSCASKFFGSLKSLFKRIIR